MTDLEIRACLSERDTLSLTLLGEARGEEFEGRLAVGCTIRERARDPKRWPDDIKGVCLQPQQFSCWNASDPNYRALMETAALRIDDHAIKSTFVSTALWKETCWLAEGLMSGVVRDRVRANHYLTRALWESGRAPKWAMLRSPVALIQRHAFFYLEEGD